ncbi:disease resistance protein RPM1-like [Elaeis guineensis]|uniref:disease resistance protein RPM1-like n=1 Tax=Elaeis guineensis var. tenera TaxID=51953 RepID=UPI003C6DA9DC
MEAYIRYVDTRKDVDKRWEGWVKILRDLVHQLEDIIDEYAFLVGEQHRRGFYDSLFRTFRHFKYIKAWRGIRRKLQDVEAILDDLSMQKVRYGVQEGTTYTDDSAGRCQHGKEPPYAFDEDEIVGFETYKSLLVGWLTDEEPLRTIMSVWGMGGLGKTTLVNDVYRSQEVKRYFDRRAWVRVSQKCTAEDLMRRLIEDLYNENRDILPGNIDTMPCDTMAEVLHAYLQQKRYLIILDDMWHINGWFVELSPVLVDSKCRSRIVITTRNHDRCHGLPLAIMAAGSSLSYREMEELEWRKFCEGLDWEETNMLMSERVRNILKLSFEDLSYHLRNCFLYCTIFLEDYLIKRKRLIRLWVAEDFVEKREGISKEEVVEENLNELIRRCMLQVVTRNRFGRPKLCRMHDIVRELTRKISEQEYFCMVYKGEETESIGKTCRLSVQKGPELFPSTSPLIRSGRPSPATLPDNLNDGEATVPVAAPPLLAAGDGRRKSTQTGVSLGMSNVRSLFVFDMTIFSSGGLLTSLQLKKEPKDMTNFSWESWTSITTSFRLLRVLDLEGFPIERVPDEVTILFNLHYLGLRRTLVKELPRSLGRLRNLRTLDLNDSKIERLPNGITQLKNLWHLFAWRIHDRAFAELASNPGVKAPEGIWNLKNLQALKSVEADEDMVRHIGNLTQLRTLRITRVRGMHSVELCSSISKMSHLVNLDITTSNEGEALQLEALKPPSFLYQKLELRGQLEHGVLPHWLREDPPPCLHALPNLAILGMYNAYDGQELRFHAGGFPKLKFLMLGGSNRLDSISMEEGALPSLSELSLLRCRGMNLLPQGIELFKLGMENDGCLSLENDKSQDGNDYAILRSPPSKLVHSSLHCKQI